MWQTLPAALLLLACVPAMAEPAGAAASRALATLFDRTCFAHPGDPAALRRMLVPPAFQPMGGEAAGRVLSGPGQAFLVADQPGPMMVLSRDDGWCGDGGQGVDPRTLTLALSTGIGRHGATMRLMGAQPGDREQHYLLLRPHRPPLALLVLLTPDGRLAQASLFASPMPDAQQ